MSYNILRVFCMMPLLLGGTAGLVFAQEIVNRTDKQIEGRWSEMGIEFSTLETEPGQVIVTIRLDAGRRIVAEVDHETRAVSLQSISDTGEAAVSAEDLGRLSLLQEALAEAGGTLSGMTLLRVLNLVTSHPGGGAIALQVAPQEEGSEKSISSLCHLTGKQVTGTYDVGEKVHQEKVKMGPCYASANKCLGRCGLGCGPLGMSTDQQFTQDCLNHDLCTKRTGDILGDCDDEWVSASDDFLFGTDCAAFNGNWRDNFKYRWALLQTADGIIAGETRGRSNVAECLPFAVLGAHSGQSVRFEAFRFNQVRGCCSSFTYTGKSSSCHQAKGTWRNSCGLKGNWTMSRQSGRTVFDFTDEEGKAVSPADSSH